MNFEDEIAKLLKKELKTEIKIEVPANSEHGDYAVPCFTLAKTLRKNPVEIAKDLASKLKSSVFEINSSGPYVNFKIKKEKIAEIILARILKERENYGRQNLGKGKKILIEHTSINPNSSPHVGRARNALIGDSLARIYRFLGYKTEVHFFVNDVGKQIAYLVLGCKGNPKFRDLLKIYVDINKKIENNEKLEKEALELLAKLEKGDKAVKSRFKRIVGICIEGQKKLFAELGIKYDKFDYESMYLWDKSVAQVLSRLEKTGKTFVDEHGRKVLTQPEFKEAMKEPLLVLTRGDGTSLYVLRDLAYTIEKMKKAEKNIIVLGEDQKLYFQQLTSALKLIGIDSPEIVHYSFILLQEEKMSTRSGNVVLLQDFMRESLEKASKELEKRYKKVDKILARKIAYGALKYSILKVSNEKNVNFDWEQALNFEGDSAPYIQYSYARASSIISKAKKSLSADLSLLKEEEELRLIKLLGEFENIVDKKEPYIIAAYSFDVAKSFNEFYHKCQVINEDKKLMNARLQLVNATRYVLKNSLWLLGIETTDKM